MTPNIAPFLLAADAERPDLKLTNTAESCFQLLKLTLEKAGPEWAFIGKTRDMDGSSVTPPGFSPITLQLTRPDGQVQAVTIVGLGMDAAWHVPTHQQVKVIVNSSANDDPDPSIHGPAKLTPYPIEAKWYRWHNPPIAQTAISGGHPAPAPTPVTLPSYADLGDDAFFRAMIGVPLFADYLMADQRPNDGMSVWFSRATYRLMAAFLKANGKPIDAAGEVRIVRNEWRGALGLPPV